MLLTYPKVSGERDPLNHLHWRWGYYYEIKIDGQWKNRSLPISARIVPQVKILIETRRSVEEIKDFILQSKHKKEGKQSDSCVKFCNKFNVITCVYMLKKHTE